MSQQSLLIHTSKTHRLSINEPIAFDGVENFAQSQYEPNNVNQALGMNSLFIYDFNFAPLNRKGRMSHRQRRKKSEIEDGFGKFDRDAVRKASAALFERLVDKTNPSSRLALATDQHFQYRRAIQYDLSREISSRINHATISSKAPRVYKHILFSVNHADLLLRQHVKAFSRETISFSKTHGAMIQKYALFMAWKNYLRPKFTKPQRRDPMTNLKTPAMYIGIEDRPLLFRDFFKQRMLDSQVELSKDWQTFFRGQSTFPRRPRKKERSNNSLRTIKP